MERTFLICLGDIGAEREIYTNFRSVVKNMIRNFSENERVVLYHLEYEVDGTPEYYPMSFEEFEKGASNEFWGIY